MGEWEEFKDNNDDAKLVVEFWTDSVCIAIDNYSLMDKRPVQMLDNNFEHKSLKLRSWNISEYKTLRRTQSSYI